MGDYGLRISADGTDVKTCSDLDAVVTSKYSLLKGATSQTFTATILSGFIHTVTFNHNQGYIPIINVAFDAGGLYGSNRYYVLPYFDIAVGDHTLKAWVDSDSNNAHVKILWTDIAHGNSLTYTLKYFRYLEKGLL